ncbi:hypothetical protein CPB83DRAFT_923985 [Crepidotus variabilis]|uniref:Uncharacterized protein n=1 Tax=Crepidotus variabilis TaxID=179855 RepID=A0A9P6ETS5_9AGAR|nr:hypothetical protein CPB83DRAFT_923985 [Crepidotus variabilis]
MLAPRPAIPLELIEVVIECLANEENLDAVQECCVANKQLVHACRKHLFAKIKVLQEPSGLAKKLSQWPDFVTPHPICRFQRLLERNSSISSYVRELEISSMEEYDFRDNLVALQYLTTVQVFTFGFSDGNRMTAEWLWATLPAEVENSLVKFVQQNPLVSVSLFGIRGLPTAFLRVFPYLESLTFLNVKLFMSSESATSPTAPVKQRKLYLQENLSSLAVQLNLQPVLDLRDLTDLSLNIGFRDNPQPALSLISLPQWLKTLSLVADASWPDFTCRDNVLTRLGPTCLTTLKKIKLEFEVSSTHHFPPYGGLIDELQAISGLNVLEEIYISTRVNFDSEYDMDPELWNQLDTVLCSGFPNFRTLSINLSVGVFAPQEVTQGTQEKLDKCFAEILQWSKKNLNFTASVEATDEGVVADLLELAYDYMTYEIDNCWPRAPFKKIGMAIDRDISR